MAIQSQARRSMAVPAPRGPVGGDATLPRGRLPAVGLDLRRAAELLEPLQVRHGLAVGEPVLVRCQLPPPEPYEHVLRRHRALAEMPLCLVEAHVMVVAD